MYVYGKKSEGYFGMLFTDKSQSSRVAVQSPSQFSRLPPVHCAERGWQGPNSRPRPQASRTVHLPWCSGTTYVFFRPLTQYLGSVGTRREKPEAVFLTKTCIVVKKFERCKFYMVRVYTKRLKTPVLQNVCLET